MDVINHLFVSQAKTMNKVLIFFLLLLLTSCGSGRFAYDEYSVKCYLSYDLSNPNKIIEWEIRHNSVECVIWVKKPTEEWVRDFTFIRCGVAYKFLHRFGDTCETLGSTTEYYEP